MSKKRYIITCTAFDKSGRVISVANNSYTDSSRLMRRFARIAGEPWKASNHAEIACINKAMKQGKIVHSLVVTRFDSFGNMKNAKPCKTCNTAIDYFKIKNVYYSTEDKGMVKL